MPRGDALGSASNIHMQSLGVLRENRVGYAFKKTGLNDIDDNTDRNSPVDCAGI
jgi:hypothetical protein